MRIVAEDRDVNDLRDRLGERDEYLTDAEGRFEILYSARQLARGDKSIADIVLSLYRREEEITEFRVYRLPVDADVNGKRRRVHFRPTLESQGRVASESTIEDLDRALTKEELRLGIPARPIETLRIVLGDAPDHREPSEYERLEEEIAPILRDRSASALDEEQHRDVLFVAREIGWPAERITEYVNAWKLADRSDIRAEVLYGLLRDGPPATLPGLTPEIAPLLEAGEHVWRAKLDDSIAQNLIPARVRGELERILPQLRDVRALQARQPMGDGRASLDEVLAGTRALESPQVRTRFIGLFLEHHGTIEEFWDRLVPNALGWGEQERREVQTALQLAELTRFNAPLLDAIRQRHAPAALSDLVRLQARDWQALVRETASQYARTDQAVAQEAERILTTLQTAYPTHTIAALTQRTADPQLREARSLLERFFASELRAGVEGAFDFRGNAVTPFLRQHKGRVFAGLDQSQQRQLSGQLQRLQRLYQLSPAPRQMESLLELGLDSAYEIATRASRDKFIELYGEPLGGAGPAGTIHDKATGIHADIMYAFTELWQFQSGPTPNVLSGTAESVQKVKETAAYSELFGNLDLCECEHCRSVYSPAAYLVDLLAFLDVPKKSAKPNPLDVLIGNESKLLTGRRPDIAHIQLTCENTHTRIPYLDIVIEILESYIEHNRPFPFNRPPTPPKDKLPESDRRGARGQSDSPNRGIEGGVGHGFRGAAQGRLPTHVAVQRRARDVSYLSRTSRLES